MIIKNQRSIVGTWDNIVKHLDKMYSTGINDIIERIEIAPIRTDIYCTLFMRRSNDNIKRKYELEIWNYADDFIDWEEYNKQHGLHSILCTVVTIRQELKFVVLKLKEEIPNVEHEVENIEGQKEDVEKKKEDNKEAQTEQAIDVSSQNSDKTIKVFPDFKDEMKYTENKNKKRR